MSKYIKKVNWPWVEIVDEFESTIIINTNDIIAVWDNSSTIYNSGIRWRNGNWWSIFSDEALTELKELLMNRKTIKTSMNIPGMELQDYEIEMMHENQTLDEWLNEER